MNMGNNCRSKTSNDDSGEVLEEAILAENVSEQTVELISHMGNCETVVNAARVSLGHRITTMSPRDYKLMEYLAKHKHYTPFEHCAMTVRVECPLYIRAQIMRHRTFSYNEISRRYVDKNITFYLPKTLRKQGKTNRQASGGDMDDLEQESQCLETMRSVHNYAYKSYLDMIKKGTSREMARGILPNSLMTEFFMTGNLRNWVHFVQLRNHEDAQPEVQEIARMAAEHMETCFAEAAKMLLDNM
ncbi:thymidylate synthase complementing protein [Tetraselmis virus 1]|uniref:Thymidylate synthase complementing protein n=1 Tax=Tetraselmis virus 1 TaxID=2060617 RepID=A0A2P0VN44_9VIRU|nr:thymidylate synthase complementing protein [Tetraselmis virus 1]AUF82332.1 thymidylate synthase complementing protein [Tetraselmis virus 1]